MGHVLGLGHSSDPGDVMLTGGQRTQESAFSRREDVLLKMMYRFRKSGNAAPDRDGGMSSASGAVQTTIVVID
jgi:hypothetical protein